MTNEKFFSLSHADSSTTVLLKPGQVHDVYYGTVRTTRKRGDYSPACEYWFFYQNTPRRCVRVGCGFTEV